MFRGWHSKGCERATRAIGGVKNSMPVTTVIMSYCDQPASRVGIRLVSYKTKIMLIFCCLIFRIMIRNSSFHVKRAIHVKDMLTLPSASP